jgi:hypothetical protein
VKIDPREADEAFWRAPALDAVVYIGGIQDSASTGFYLSKIDQAEQKEPRWTPGIGWLARDPVLPSL